MDCEESGSGLSSEPMLPAPADIKEEPPLDIDPEPIEPSPAPPRPTLTALRPFACDRGCEKRFFTEADLAKHRELCNTVPACPVCGQIYRSRKAMQKHKANAHKEKPYKCRVTPGCPARFPKMILQRKHEILCGNGTLPSKDPDKCCPACNKSFRTVVSRISHQQLCGLTTTCTICGTKTANLKSMLYHMNKHKGLNPYPCRSGGSGCGQSFHSRGSRDSHELRCQGQTQRVVQEEEVRVELTTPPCMNCGKTFPNHDHLVRHFKLCQFEKPKPTPDSTENQPEPNQESSCQACGQQFPSTGALSVHQITCTLMRTCTICSKDFASRTSLTYHMNWHYGILPFECRATPGCRFRFSSSKKRNVHEKGCALKAQQQQKEQPCTTNEDAGVEVEKEDAEVKASESSSSQPGFPCGTCDKVCSTVAQRKAHQTICGLTTTCAICGKQMATIKTMVYHMNMHKGHKPYECREGTGCGFRFYGPGARNAHEVNCKKNNKKCKKIVAAAETAIAADVTSSIDHDQNREECPAETPAKGETPLTMKQEPEPEPSLEEPEYPEVKVVPCSGCKKSFASEKFLKMHQDNCTARKDCNICGKSFTNRTSLKYHLNVHNGVTPFTCRKTPGCRAKFFDTTSRYYHETYCGQYGPEPEPPAGKSSRYSARSYKCSGCGQEFASVVVLSQHQVRCNVSTDCVYCGLTLSSITTLQYHINRHKGITPYKCPYCPAKYSNPSGRNTHERQCYARKNKASGSSKPE